LVSEVRDFPEGFEYQTVNLDLDTANQQITQEMIDQIPDVTQDARFKDLIENLKDYLSNYPVKDNEEFLQEVLREVQKNEQKNNTNA
jgi:hypothetical protein